MKVALHFRENLYEADLSQPIDISVPLQNGKDNPNCYYAEPVRFESIRMGNFIGNVAEGGVCNHKKITLSPHGNGTHTECYGHISADATATIHACLRQFHFVAQLISVRPQLAENGGFVVRLVEVTALLDSLPPEALIIRTLPNDTSKTTRQYSGTNPPYLEPALCEYLAQKNVKHLLTDLPSVDREVDDGNLLAHRAFWQFPKNIRRDCTITELIYVPNWLSDGWYLLQLQIVSLALDASPSKPVLYAIKNT